MLKQCIIIGGGPAGTAAALAAVGEGGAGSVLLVERDAFGGTCTNRGCIPTKFLLSRSEALTAGESAAGRPSGWAKVLAHKNALVQGLSRSIETKCRARGIEIARGSARFITSHAIEVRDAAGRLTVYEGERIVIATGSRPAELPARPPTAGPSSRATRR
jgi:dihydrolipoamide dehydrogenase